MTLVIELGAPTTGANTYATEAEFTTYLTDRGYTVTATAEPLLIRSFDFMAGLNWIADHTDEYMVTDAHKRGQCEIAYRMSLGADPTATVTAGSVKREKVDVLETEYFSNSNRVSTMSFLRSMPQAHRFLKSLIHSGTYIGRA